MSTESGSSHILSNFQDSLDQLRKDVLTMASMAQLNLDHSVRGLLDREGSMCKAAIADDEDVDQLGVTNIAEDTIYIESAEDVRHA